MAKPNMLASYASGTAETKHITELEKSGLKRKDGHWGKEYH